MIKLELLTTPDCAYCAKAKEILKEVKPDFPDVKIEEIDLETQKGQEMTSKYMIMSSPGLVINGELFSTGAVDKEKLVAKLKSL